MATSPSSKKRVWLIVILGVVSATGPLSIDLYLPALPAMAQNLQTQTSLVQLSLSACLLGLAIGQLVAGPLSDKYGRKKPLLIGFLVFTLMSLLIAVSHAIWLLIGLRFVQGLAGASGQVLSRAIVSDLFSGPLLTKFYSMLSAVNGIFPVISPIMGGYIIKFVDWQGIFIVLAVIGLLITLAVWLGVKETLPVKNRIAGSPLNSVIEMLQLLKNGKFVKLVLGSGLIYGALFSYISASSFVFQSDFHMSVASFGFLYALNGIGIAIGSAIPGFLASRISEATQIRIILSSTLVTALILILSSFMFSHLVIVIGLVFLLVLQFGMLFTLTTSVVMNLTLQNSGGISALLGLSQNAIGSMMSPLVGLLGTQTYLPMAVAIALCIGLSLVLFTGLTAQK